MDAARFQDEQTILAILLLWPDENRWEIDGLEAALFEAPAHRDIAKAICHLRDQGRAIHWRRVRRLLVKLGRAYAAELVAPLRRGIGVPLGLTAAISRLHYAAANHRRAA